MNNPNNTLVVIGGGAAGFFCAINAAMQNKNLQVIIIEKTNKLLSKVKVSGGGRCNVTHNCFDIEELCKKYPRGNNFLKKAFHWFNTNDTINWFNKYGVTLHTEQDGRMFPSTNNSETIVNCLLQQAANYNVQILTSTEIISITHQNTSFEIATSAGSLINCKFVCVATGGYSKALQFQWLQKLGHSIQNPIPSLFTFNIPNTLLTQLMGVSVPNAIIKVQHSKLISNGPLLITHWGLSGPCVLKLSAFGAKEFAEKGYNFSIAINFLPNYTTELLQSSWHTLRQQNASSKIFTKNIFALPNRLWQYLLQQSNIAPNLNWADVNSNQQNLLIKNLTNYTLQVQGKTTFKEEFVTCGGISLQEINVNTMQSKIVPNLFFAGEVLDIDGITGGFNFQNAWTTGYIAAKAIANTQ